MFCGLWPKHKATLLASDLGVIPTISRGIVGSAQKCNRCYKLYYFAHDYLDGQDYYGMTDMNHSTPNLPRPAMGIPAMKLPLIAATVVAWTIAAVAWICYVELAIP
jgi:hypothetical protein